MSGKPVSVLLLCADAELSRPILAIFSGLSDRIEVSHVGNMPAARRVAHALENAPQLVVPQLIVVVQTWPDEFSTGDVIELLATYPVARLICLEGEWCDSVGRNRQLWPLACRCRLEAAPVRLAQEIAHFDLGRDDFQPAAGMPGRPGRPLPLTASRAEVFADEFAAGERRLAPGLLLAVDSPDRPFREMLESSLSRGGFRVCTRNRPEAPEPLESTHRENTRQERAGLPSSLEGEGLGLRGTNCQRRSIAPSPPAPLPSRERGEQKCVDTQAPDLLVWDADLRCAAAALHLRDWQHRHPATPIVACAGFLRPDLTDELIRRGVAGCWFKLAPLAQLFDAITAAAARPPAGCEMKDRSWDRAPAG